MYTGGYMVAKYKNSKDFYAKNPAAAQKKSDDNNSGKNGRFAHTNAYKRKHANARNNSLKINPDQDMVTQSDGSLKPGNRRNNRIAGAKKGAARRTG